MAGALGRMGRVACAALRDAPGSVMYAGGFARARVPEEQIVDNLEELFARGVDVLLDLTTHPGTVEISMAAATHGVRPVIGATGWSDSERAVLAQLATERGIG
ncbi:MAG TPA: hypothetical protein VKR05_01430, partial [Candidatus Cybelea sp.]|nr:hypothetical protein [Candidatus Cybelea sp.]